MKSVGAPLGRLLSRMAIASSGSGMTCRTLLMGARRTADDQHAQRLGWHAFDGAEGGVDEWNLAPLRTACVELMAAGRSADVHLALKAAIAIDLHGVVQAALDALAQPCAGIVVLGQDRQDDRHEFGRLQVE